MRSRSASIAHQTQSMPTTDFLNLGGLLKAVRTYPPWQVATELLLIGLFVFWVLRFLRERGMLTFREGVATVHDRAALRAIAEFDTGYLYPHSSDLLRDTRIS